MSIESGSTAIPGNPAEAYQTYFVPAMFVPCAQVLLAMAKPQTGEYVLDVACGTGIVSRMVAPLVGASGHVVGLDVNAAMLAVARSQPAAGTPIEWREESALAMTLPDAVVDLVLCQQGLQFFPDKPAGVREMRRVLKPGGRAVVACWCGLDRAPVFNAVMHAQARHLNLPLAPFAMPHSMNDSSVLHDLFATAGFQHVQVTSHDLAIHFPHPNQFVQRAIQSASAAVPALQQMPAAARTQLAEAISRELHDELRQYIQGDFLVSPQSTWLVLAS